VGAVGSPVGHRCRVFFWPAGQALLQSLQEQDAFGLSVNWVGLDNFKTLLSDSAYLASFKTTAVFSVLVAVLGIALSLVLAVFADRIIRGTLAYRTLLIVPYAVAPAVAGVWWVFMFSPSIGVVSYLLSHAFGFEWNHLLNSNHAMTLIVTAAVWKQISYNFLFFLAGHAIDSKIADRSGCDGRRVPVAALLDDPVPPVVPHHVFPAGHQHGVRLLRHLCHHRCHHPWVAPVSDTVILVYKVYQDGFKGGDIGGAAAQSVILMLVVIAMTIFQFRYIEKKVQY